MRYPAFIFALLTNGLLAGTAFAGGTQTLSYPDVVKLPAQPGEQVLLYPGGQYGRVVPYELKQPGAEIAPIHLHKPAHHRHSAVAQTHPVPQHPHTHTAPAEVKTATVKAVPAKPVVRDAFVAPQGTKPKPAPKPVVKPAAKPVTHIAKAAPAPTKPAAKSAPPLTKPKTPKKTPKPVHVAKAEPAPHHTHTPFYARQGNAGHKMAQISFQQSASQPNNQEIERINALAGQLNEALTGRSRVQILAYAGPKDNKTSSARRLSLKRALILRQLLIDGGVPADRIDVRAMGGITDTGVPERVDVYLKN